MITSQNCNLVIDIYESVGYKHTPFGISDFEAYQQRKDFYTKVASVYIISKKEVIGVWGKSTDSEHLNEVVKLTMPKLFTIERGHERTDPLQQSPDTSQVAH